MKNFFRSVLAGLGLTAAFTAGNLNASMVTKNVSIPFEFKVDKTTMPAGEYRLEQDFGDLRMWVINVKTGQRVLVLRDNSRREEGRARMIFEPTGQGYKLTRVW